MQFICLYSLEDAPQLMLWKRCQIFTVVCHTWPPKEVLL